MYWYDGELCKATQLALPVSEPGLLFGATVFTTLRSRGGRPVVWEAHRDRLERSAIALGWQLPDWGRVERGLQELAALYPAVRVTLFPDGREWIIGRALPANLTSWQSEGVRALVVDDLARSLPAHKTGNYLACWQARRQARQRQAEEAILADAKGAWLETSTGNLWGWRQGTWLTPPLTAGILPGIARSRLWQALKAAGKSPATPVWDADLIAQFEAIAYCNCLVGVVPLREAIWPTGKTQAFAVNCPALRELQQQLPECLAEF